MGTVIYATSTAMTRRGPFTAVPSTYSPTESIKTATVSTDLPAGSSCTSREYRAIALKQPVDPHDPQWPIDP